MLTKSYSSAIEFLSQNAPDMLAWPTKFIQWVEVNADLMNFTLDKDYDDVIEDITEACKEQGYESNE